MAVSLSGEKCAIMDLNLVKPVPHVPVLPIPAIRRQAVQIFSTLAVAAQ